MQDKNDVTGKNDNDVMKDEKNGERVGRELNTKSSKDFVRTAAELNNKYLKSEARMRLDKEFEVIGDVFESLKFYLLIVLQAVFFLTNKR